jgi:hypothetical protein
LPGPLSRKSAETPRKVMAICKKRAFMLTVVTLVNRRQQRRSTPLFD